MKDYSFEEVISMLEHDEDIYVSSAIQLLAKYHMGYSASLKLITARKNHVCWLVRCAVAWALGQYPKRNQLAQHTLTNMVINDVHSDVRHAAADALFYSNRG